jgi:hypothetical protein
VRRRTAGAGEWRREHGPIDHWHRSARGDRASREPGARVDRNRIDAKALVDDGPLARVDQRVGEGEQQQAHAARPEHERRRPELLVDRDQLAGQRTEQESDAAANPERASVAGAQPRSSAKAQRHRRECAKSAEDALGILAAAGRHVERVGPPSQQPRIDPIGHVQERCQRAAGDEQRPVEREQAGEQRPLRGRCGRGRPRVGARIADTDSLQHAEQSKLATRDQRGRNRVEHDAERDQSQRARGSCATGRRAAC